MRYGPSPKLSGLLKKLTVNEIIVIVIMRSIRTLTEKYINK